MSKPTPASDRSSLIRLASSMDKGSAERRVILAGLKVGVMSDRPPQISLRSPIASLKKAESLYEVDGSRDGDVLHLYPDPRRHHPPIESPHIPTT